MIVSVTVNTSIDHIVFIPALELNKTLRARKIVISIGGKPTDAAWILGELGIPSLALGYTAGHTGEIMKTLLHEKGVQTDFISVAGESRRNIIIIGEDEGSHTTITASTLMVSEADILALRVKLESVLATASCVVLGGTLAAGMSPDFYTDFIGLIRSHDVPVVFDASEPYLSAGLKARPNYVKPNLDELSAYAGRRLETLADAYYVGREILAEYGACPIITFGDDGGLAVLPDRAYRIPALKVPFVNPAGAGDGVLAGITQAVAQRKPIEEGIRQGFANASAVVMMPGTAECRREDVERLLPQVQLIPYEP